jgi:CheY-like chemotaxis protein
MGPRPFDRKRRVLLILEREEDRAEAAELLSVAGYEAHIRSSPIGATVEIVRSGIDVVVIDVDIDVMSGDRFAGLIRQNDRLDHVGLVLVSDESAFAIAELTRKVAAEAGISRTALGRSLVGAVENALGRARGRRPSRPPSGVTTILVLRSGRFDLPLIEGHQLVGRDADCRFVLNHGSVSRHHAAIEVRGIRARIRDLGSRNGTSVNGERLEDSRDLDIGDVITIGDEELVLTAKAQISRETARFDEEPS